MILTEKKYVAQRGKKAETYQAFSVTMEVEQARKYITVELDHLNRWRSVAEYADYLAWCREEILKLEKI
jgi:hypothetical protein